MRIRRRRLLPILLLAGWTAAPAQGVAAPSPAPERLEASPQEIGLPFLRNFSPKEYGGETQSWAFAQDPRGVIYVANTGGVLEFDGLRWRLIPTANRTIVRSLAVDAAGRVYVGANGEIGYLEPDAAGQTRYVSLLEHLPPEARDFADVWGTFVMRDGVYFATNQELLRVQGDAVQVWKPGTTFHLPFRVRDRLFIRERERGLMELVAGRLVLVPGGERFAEERIYAMLPGPAAGPGENAPEAILVGSRTQGLFVFDGTSFRSFPTEADAAIKRDLLYSGARMSDGNVALGTILGGVYFVDPQGRLIGHLGKAGGLQDDSVYAIFPDREHGLWLGLGRGLARAEAGSPVTRFDERAALPGELIAVGRHRGRLYACTGQGLFRLTAGPEPRFEPLAGIQNQTWALASVGDALLAANADGVYAVQGDAAVLVRKDMAFALHASRVTPGRVFVGLLDGLASMRNERGRWVDEGPIPGVSGEIRTLLEMPDGRLWVGTRTTGVFRVSFAKDGTVVPLRVERFDTASGLPGLHEDRVFPIGGEALFGTHQGVFRFDEGRGRFEPDPRFAALFPEGARKIFSLAEDPQGRIWMGSTRDPKEAGTAVGNPDGTYSWNPQPLRSFAGASVESIHADGDGVLWFGGDEGLFRYDPRLARDYGRPFTALVRQVSHPGGGESLFGGAGEAAAPTLAYADNALRFEYAAPSFDGPGATRFQVWLEGNDRDWSPWTDEGYREYTNLREGGYHFRVRARNVYGVVSAEGVYAFRVRPPWYRTLWAYLAYLLAAVGLGWALVRWRVRSVEAEKRELEGTVAARTAELHAKNAQLETSQAATEEARSRAVEASRAKSQFLANMSHELRTPLNAIIGYSEMLEEQANDLGQESLVPDLERIRGSGRHLLALINDILDLSKVEAGKMTLIRERFPVFALLNSVVTMVRPLVEKNGNVLELRCADGLEDMHNDATRVRQILFNLLSNACKFTKGGTITLDVRRDDAPGSLRFAVRDTGIGMTKEQLGRLFQAFSQAEESTSRKFGGTGLGLVISLRFAQLMGGTITVESAPGEGTTFTAILPVSIPDPRDEPVRAVAS